MVIISDTCDGFTVNDAGINLVIGFNIVNDINAHTLIDSLRRGRVIHSRAHILAGISPKHPLWSFSMIPHTVNIQELFPYHLRISHFYHDVKYGNDVGKRGWSLWYHFTPSLQGCVKSAALSATRFRNISNFVHAWVDAHACHKRVKMGRELSLILTYLLYQVHTRGTVQGLHDLS